jgi:serine/threonine-protein kinase
VIGQRFGNYRAVSLLGEGGMGAVYLAEHPEIGRRVAVKVLRPELIRDPGLLVRFMNEARAANAIRHPNIIEVLDSGTTSEGVPYLVMELLEGEVLSARIRRVRQLPLREALEFSYQSASALAAAHLKGIIHRDLKPDNLFIVRDPADPSREMIKVLDFGIAKLQTLPTGSGMQTRTGTLMGTPVYMSPEQCLGTKLVDQRSDIYALGIIMFEMLAGRPPFLSEGFGELVNMHLNARPPSLRDLNTEVTLPVEALIAKALEKAPEARQRSATELQADIREAVGKSMVIRGASSPDLVRDTMPGNTAGHARVPTAVLSQSTTMSSTTGERFIPTVKSGGRRGAAIIIVSLLVTMGGVGGWYALTRMNRDKVTGEGDVAADRRVDPARSGSATKDVPRPTAVRVSIDSEPPGAAVTDVRSGEELGVTPLVLERPSSATPMTVRLDKPGFARSTREIALSQDARETIPLLAVPVPGDATPHQANHPVTKPGPPKVKVQKERPHHPVMRAEEEPAKL